MDYNALLETLLENVKDDSSRKKIYIDLIQSMIFSDLEDLKHECEGIDPIFDEVFEEYGAPLLEEEEEDWEDEDEVDDEEKEDEDWDDQGRETF